MQPLAFLLSLFTLLLTSAYAQDIDTHTLDKLFNSLEERNEAMGSIIISKNGRVLYERVIGYRYISDDEKTPASAATNYRIWSITKTYTATMIMQLIEEGKLSLQTTLDRFYPEIPNAKIITIQDMLKHRSGIHDFTQNDSSEDWDTSIDEALSPAFMAENIAQYAPDFQPDQDFRYSNSNYLLLGYIIEKLDDNLYEASLANRISAKIALTSTYFGVGALDSINNKAFSYHYDKGWNAVDEGNFSGLIPAGAGGIVATPADMALFIEALFAGKLISKSSLEQMLPSQGFYGLGIMQLPFHDTPGFGHTGGFTASEASLVYFPQDSITIAYATNGIVISKEDILNHVLNIYHGKPFAVSMDRALQALLIFGSGLLFIIVVRSKSKTYPSAQSSLSAGWIIAAVFWLGLFIAGFLYGDYSHIRDGLTQLDSFYSASGTFMAGVQLIISMLCIPLLWELYKSCKNLKINFLPVLPIGFIPVSLLGSSLFPFPNSLYPFFVNIILLTILGPLLAVVLWRKEQLSGIRRWSAISLLCMLICLGFLLSRPSIPELVHNYWGLIQRLLFLGWTSWLTFLSLYFVTALQQVPNKF